MKRVGAIVLFAGAVLLSTHILAPAEPPAPPVKELAASRAVLTQAAPLVEQVDAEVARLRERLATRPSYPPPSRDPFRFGARPVPPGSTPAAAIAAPIAEAPRPPVPQLIAISTTPGAIDGGVSIRTAVLGIGDNVQVVKAGDTFMAFLVKTVGVDAVELVESATGRATTVSLR